MLQFQKAMKLCDKAMYRPDGSDCLRHKEDCRRAEIIAAVRALRVSVTKKSINDMLPVMSETDFVFPKLCGTSFMLFTRSSRLRSIAH